MSKYAFVNLSIFMPTFHNCFAFPTTRLWWSSLSIFLIPYFSLVHHFSILVFFLLLCQRHLFFYLLFPQVPISQFMYCFAPPLASLFLDVHFSLASALAMAQKLLWSTWYMTLGGTLTGGMCLCWFSCISLPHLMPLTMVSFWSTCQI